MSQAGVGAHGFQPTIVHGQATQNDFDLLPQAGLSQGFDGAPHGIDGHGQDARHAQDAGLILFDVFDKGRWRHVGAQVVDLKATVPGQGDKDVFANVVQIAFDCTDNSTNRSRCSIKKTLPDLPV